MADDILTIADLVGDALDLSDAMVTDLLRDSPFFSRLPVVSSSNGDTHKYVKETGAPVVGFRAENAGRDLDHSEDTVVTVTLKILDFSWRVDKAVADRWRKGGAQALIEREGRRHLRSAFFEAEQQYIQGVNNDASGFVGFQDSTQLDALADTMTYNGGGTGGGSVYTSVYAVREGEDDVAGVMIDGSPIELGETTVIDVLDGSSQHYPAYYTPGTAWIGMQIGSARSVGRICNLDTGSNKLTDAKMYGLLEAFPVGRQPTVWLMNRQSLEQLRSSRTATNQTGAPAPRPTEVAGIPIVAVESITSTEAEVT